MRHSAVVTGVGALGAFGFGRRALLEALREARPAPAEASPPDRPFPGSRRARLGLFLPSDDFSEWIPRRTSRRMSRPSRMAVAAAKLALEDALLDDAPGSLDDASVVLGTAFGPADFTERLLAELFVEPQQASPFLFSECVANAPAGQVAIATGASGPNTTITQREASGLLALIEASREVASGRARRALAGCSEELTPLMHAILDRFGALAHVRHCTPEAARPFDRRRSGFFYGEGASVLVLEDEDGARDRGAPMRARVRATIRGNDASAPAWGWGGDARTLARRVASGLERAGLAPGDIRLVVSGASGSVQGDALEAAILRELWPHGTPPLVAPKAVTGEYGGGQLAAAVFCTEYLKTWPTAGFEEGDPDLGVEPCRERLSIEPGPVLVSSLAAGGPAAWVVLEPCP